MKEYSTFSDPAKNDSWTYIVRDCDGLLMVVIKPITYPNFGPMWYVDIAPYATQVFGDFGGTYTSLQMAYAKLKPFISAEFVCPRPSGLEIVTPPSSARLLPFA